MVMDTLVKLNCDSGVNYQIGNGWMNEGWMRLCGQDCIDKGLTKDGLMYGDILTL